MRQWGRSRNFPGELGSGEDGVGWRCDELPLLTLELFELSGCFENERWLARLLGGGVGDDGTAVGLVVMLFGGHAIREIERGFGNDFIGFGSEGILGGFGQCAEPHRDVA